MSDHPLQPGQPDDPSQQHGQPQHQRPKPRPLSEISHLFLSSVRNQQTGGTPLPKRTPPGQQGGSSDVRRDVSMDMTPEEFARAFGEVAPAPGGADDHRAPVSALIGGHLNGKQFDKVKAYARHLAADRQRIGLIEIDAHEFRLMCFDGHGGQVMTAGAPQGHVAPAAEAFDARRVAEALEEMGWDVDRWLLCVPNPRTAEARTLLRAVPHWVLLSSCDHDGVVSAYRMIKGLADAPAADVAAAAAVAVARPRLSLALLDAADEPTALRTFRKLSSVCGQFLQWPLDPEPTVVAAYVEVAEHLVMCCRTTREQGHAPDGPHWRTVLDFLTRGPATLAHDPVEMEQDAGDAPQAPDAPDAQAEPRDVERDAQVAARPDSPARHNQEHPPMVEPIVSAEEARHFVQPLAHDGPDVTPAEVAPAPASPAGPAVEAPALHMRLTPAVPVPESTASSVDDDVIELVGDQADEAGVLTSILRHRGGTMIECPLRPPMCPKARLAVGRDRRLVLLAVARQGLGDLRAIGRAYQWLSENRTLIAMAMPQFAIDASLEPHLNLFVDQSDAAADILQPMLQSSKVTIHTYRRLRWGGRTGLLLDAA